MLFHDSLSNLIYFNTYPIGIVVDNTPYFADDSWIADFEEAFCEEEILTSDEERKYGN